MADLLDASVHPVFIVRHGESEWNVARLTQGQTSHPALTDRGREQVRAAGDDLVAVLAQHPVPQVWTSDLVRARQSAEIVATALAPRFPDVAAVPDQRLREQHLGSLEGRSYEETWAAGESHDWSDPTLPVAGGESPAQVHARMTAVLEDAFVAAASAPVVLVSHGDAIRVGLAQLAGFGPGEGEWIDVPNGAVFELTPTGHRRLS